MQPIERGSLLSPREAKATPNEGPTNEARDALERRSDQEFRTLVQQSPVLLWMSGPDMQCTFINEGWLRFTGRTLEQELGSGWTEGIHAEDFVRTLDRYLEAFMARRPCSLSYRLRRHDAVYRWVHDERRPRYDEDGAFVGYVGAAIDIHERHAAEIALEQSLRAERLHSEREVVSANGALRRRIGHDLHDGLGQLLVDAALTARGLQRQAPPELAGVAGRLVEMLNDAAARVQNISRGLAPMRIGGLRVSNALAKICEDACVPGVDCKLDVDAAAEHQSEMASAQICLIVQEAVRNALGHGRATRIGVRLRSYGDRTVLSIHDNGFGLREGGAKPGLGLEGMRYRASALGGTLRITNPSTGGTRVRCVWSMLPSAAQRARAAALFKP